MKLDKKKLLSLGFKSCEGNSFENINLPYFVKNAICLFYNESDDRNIYNIGYGFTYDGKYYAATFRWITELKELEDIYLSINHEKL